MANCPHLQTETVLPAVINSSPELSALAAAIALPPAKSAVSLRQEKQQPPLMASVIAKLHTTRNAAHKSGAYGENTSNSRVSRVVIMAQPAYSSHTA